MSQSLWPEDLSVSQVRPPIAILREQATFLGNSTNAIVSGLVTPDAKQIVSGSLFNARLIPRSEDETFSYNFYITAPSLGSYRYLLLTVSHGFNLYPVKIVAEEDIMQDLGAESESLVATSEEEFENCLARIFNAGKTRRVIAGLLSQVVDAK